MGLKARSDIALYSATRMEDILRAIVTMRPVAAIVDSIQTVYLDGVTGSAGSVSQVSRHDIRKYYQSTSRTHAEVLQHPVVCAELSESPAEA